MAAPGANGGTPRFPAATDGVPSRSARWAADRRDRRLALRAGHADDAGAVGLLQPHAEAAEHGHAGSLERRDVVAVPRDPRRLDDGVATRRTASAVARSRGRPPRRSRRGRRRRGRPRSRAQRGASRAARPSTPSPKTPTRRPARSLNEIACRMERRRARGSEGSEQLVERPRRARTARRGPRGVAAPARSPRAATATSAVAHSSTSPTHSKGFALSVTPQSTSSSATRAGSPGLAAREHLLEARAVDERREHQVREEALVALAAPRRRPRRGILSERPVAAHERREVLLVARELARDPQLGAVAKRARVLRRAGKELLQGVAEQVLAGE